MTKRYKKFSDISLIIVGFYCLANALIILGWGPRFNFEAYLVIAEAVLFVDLCTWHIYGLFAIVGFIIKICFICEHKELLNKAYIKNLIFHFLFSAISFLEIWWIFENSF